MWNIDFPQSIGIIAFLVGVSAFWQKDGRHFRLHLMVFQAVLFIHFILMGAWVAAAGCGVSAVRSYASTKTNSVWVMTFFIIALWAFGLPKLQYAYELLALFGSSVATYGLFRAQGVAMRLMILFNSFCWLTNNLLLGSIGGSMMEATFIVTNIVTIVRMVRQSRQEPQQAHSR